MQTKYFINNSTQLMSMQKILKRQYKALKMEAEALKMICEITIYEN
jgi:hypothetical protein